MDVFERDGGTTTADTVHKREEFRQIVADVQELPETQRTALLLREIDALSYDQIAEAMETTVPSVKSLLVRARVSLAEAAEARLLTCEEVRDRAWPGRRGPRRAPRRRCAATCAPATAAAPSAASCAGRTGRSPPIYPIGPLIFLKKLIFAKLIFSGSGAAAASAGGGARAAPRERSAVAAHPPWAAGFGVAPQWEVPAGRTAAATSPPWRRSASLALRPPRPRRRRQRSPPPRSSRPAPSR